jgi:SAM-dependent methyltransferase
MKQAGENMKQEAFSRHLTLWAEGIDEELAFWDNWFAKKGGVWADDYCTRLEPHREIDPELMTGLAGTCVLDVGAGPMTVLGHMYNGQSLDFTACDPLAPFYAEIAAKNGVQRPVKTQLGFAEDLSAFFPSDYFDLVHCRNALDHSFDPVRGIEEMLIVAKPGGRIALGHARNEGEAGLYQGLHQWNFDADGGDFIIWNKVQRINASERFAPYADIEIDTPGERWISVRMRKKASPPVTAGRCENRLREVLSAMVGVFGSMR